MSDFKVYKAGPYYNLGTIYAVITGEKSVNSKDMEIKPKNLIYMSFEYKE